LAHCNFALSPATPTHVDFPEIYVHCQAQGKQINAHQVVSTHFSEVCLEKHSSNSTRTKSKGTPNIYQEPARYRWFCVYGSDPAGPKILRSSLDLHLNNLDLVDP